MMTSLTILGGGGHSSDVLGVLEAISMEASEQRPVVRVTDDHWTKRSRFARRSVELIDGLFTDFDVRQPFIVGIGYPKGREAVARRAKDLGAQPYAAIFHPMAAVSSDASISDGSVVFGMAWLSPGVSLAENVHILYGASVGHDTVIGPNTTIMPGSRIGGDVQIGDATLIGAGAVVLQGVRIGAGATVGAGAVATRDVHAGETVVGVPARPIREKRTL